MKDLAPEKPGDSCCKPESELIQDTWCSLTTDIQHLCDNFLHTQRENGRFQSIVSDTLTMLEKEAVVPAISDRTKTVQCEICHSLKSTINQLNQEKDKLEFMKPYTEELLTKNNIATTKVRVLEKELSEMKRSGTERDMKQRRYISNIEIIKEDVTIVQEQVRTCQQHLTQLRQQISQLETRNAAQDTLNNFHQKVITDNHETICLLRQEIMKLHRQDVSDGITKQHHET